MKPKKAKALEPLELVAACQSWLDAQRAGEPVAPAAEPVAEEPLTPGGLRGCSTSCAKSNRSAHLRPRPNKKRKREEEAAKAGITSHAERGRHSPLKEGLTFHFFVALFEPMKREFNNGPLPMHSRPGC